MARLRLMWLTAVLILIGCLVCLPESSALGRAGRGKPPAWVAGGSAEYPEKRYLTGVGQGETRRAAEDQAYAAIARPFDQ